MNKRLVTLKVFSTLVEAELVSNALASEGIESFLPEANMGDIIWNVNGVALQVTSEDFSSAQEFLSQLNEDSIQEERIERPEQDPDERATPKTNPRTSASIRGEKHRMHLRSSAALS